jgi:hypothetical protein
MASFCITGITICYHKAMEYRAMSEYEKKLLDKLLSANFRDVEVLRDQASSAKVRNFADDKVCNPSIEFNVNATSRAELTERIPVELRTQHREPYIEFLLHVSDGKIEELEYIIYSMNVIQLFPLPNIDDLTIIVNQH